MMGDDLRARLVIAFLQARRPWSDKQSKESIIEDHNDAEILAGIAVEVATKLLGERIWG